jgi:hypothetical protein
MTPQQISDIADDAVNLRDTLAERGFSVTWTMELTEAAMPVIVACETGKRADGVK